MQSIILEFAKFILTYVRTTQRNQISSDLFKLIEIALFENSLRFFRRINTSRTQTYAIKLIVYKIVNIYFVDFIHVIRKFS